MPHWQTLVALGIVLATLLIFLIRLLRPAPKGGCGHGCGCEANSLRQHSHKDPSTHPESPSEESESSAS